MNSGCQRGCGVGDILIDAVYLHAGQPRIVGELHAGQSAVPVGGKRLADDAVIGDGMLDAGIVGGIGFDQGVAAVDLQIVEYGWRIKGQVLRRSVENNATIVVDESAGIAPVAADGNGTAGSGQAAGGPNRDMMEIVGAWARKGRCAVESQGASSAGEDALVVQEQTVKCQYVCVEIEAA